VSNSAPKIKIKIIREAAIFAAFLAVPLKPIFFCYAA
jgi:hypothetical protein